MLLFVTSSSTCMTHQSPERYTFVLQSLLLWREIMGNMSKPQDLWMNHNKVIRKVSQDVSRLRSLQVLLVANDRRGLVGRRLWVRPVRSFIGFKQVPPL